VEKIFIFVFGTIIGSFLNVVIYRIPKGESIIFPNSKCPKCGYFINWYDNIPIVSWLLLNGKCRNCSGSISYRYLSVELIVGLLFYLHI
jgi:leader peptidase (prepilin peptidase)/N-methyltransferase